MEKKIRVDRKKNVGKVAEVLAKKPHATTKEIKELAGVSQGTVHNATKELELNGTKDPTIAYIVGSSKNRMKRSQGIFDRWLDQIEEQDKIATRDIVVVKDIANDDMKRVTVLGGELTDDEGGLKDLASLTIAQLEEQRRLLLGN